MNFKIAIGMLLAIFLLAGGYVGYLSALVDIDEYEFFQRVEAATDKQRLEKQLARAKSILDARSRAYIRRSQEFLRKKQLEAAGVSAVPVQAEEQQQVVSQINETLSTVNPGQLGPEEQKEFQSLQEEQGDLTFFQDEVGVIEQVLAREVDQEDITVLLAGDRKRRMVSDSLRQLLLVLDKRKELAQKRSQAKDGYQYWEQNPKGSPDGISITVHNKDSISRELNPLHVTQISTALSVMPQGFDQRLQTMYIVYGDAKMRRGMSGVGVVFMKGEELDFFRVLVHEFGHTYDLHREVAEGEKSQFYDGQYRLFAEDPSVMYYEYSWKSTSERAAEASAFASTYGMSDPFEDFAEVFALYILQNETFASWKKSDPVMAKKFDFMSRAFNGRTFKSVKKFLTQPYDVTMLAVDYEELLKVGG